MNGNRVSKFCAMHFLPQIAVTTASPNHHVTLNNKCFVEISKNFFSVPHEQMPKKQQMAVKKLQCTEIMSHISAQRNEVKLQTLLNSYGTRTKNQKEKTHVQLRKAILISPQKLRGHRNIIRLHQKTFALVNYELNLKFVAKFQ